MQKDVNTKEKNKQEISSMFNKKSKESMQELPGVFGSQSEKFRNEHQRTTGSVELRRSEQFEDWKAGSPPGLSFSCSHS